MILIRRCLCQWMGRETIERVRMSSLENAIKNKPISKSQETNVMLVSDLLNILVYFSYQAMLSSCKFDDSHHSSQKMDWPITHHCFKVIFKAW